MVSGWRYRVVSTGGTVLATALAVLVANHPLIQWLITARLPVFNHLPAIVLTGSDLLGAVALTVTAVFLGLIPLYKPRPRRILDTILLAQKHVAIAMFALATLGYFNWSSRLPRATLFATGVLLVSALPGWFLVIRNRPVDDTGRAIVVGDVIDRISQAISTVDMRVVGCLSSPPAAERETERGLRVDGGTLRPPIEGARYLGGISRLEAILVEYDVDTVVLAFDDTDRGEFFGVLETCHKYGVEAKVLHEHTDSVLLAEGAAGDLLTVDLKPWDWQERLFKRGFDIAFAAAGLLALAPVAGAIALAIELEGPGPVFYTQNRTTGFGGTFRVRKFRTMRPESEAVDPIDDEDDDRITRIGRLLRASHLDELPQLWSILVGDMSVVGPRAVWTDEEAMLEAEAIEWKKRWFVKPGLTGLAQINDVSSTDPARKLRYDLGYIRHQSFRLDLKIVLRQIWTVMTDVYAMVRADDRPAGDRGADGTDER